VSALDVTSLSVGFGDRQVLRGVSFDVGAGETVVLFGPSGVGKTVMLRAIAGLEPRARGRIVLNGRDVSAAPPEARRIGMAFQNFALYPHMTAFENVASPLNAQGIAAPAMGERVRALARLLKIDHVLEHLPRQLSNGQKQRTALARALVGEPDLVLFDDPLRNVDAKLRYEMRIELPRLLARRATPSLYVTQDFREAMAIGERVAVLVEGGIAQLASGAEVYERPATLAVARLFGDPPMNLVPAQAEARGGGVLVRAAGLGFGFATEMPDDPIFGIRPEGLVLHRDSGPGRTAAKILAVTPASEQYVVLARTEGGIELLLSRETPPPSEGTEVWIGAARGSGALFDRTSGLCMSNAPVMEEAVA